jgi:hypothetical protein
MNHLVDGKLSVRFAPVGDEDYIEYTWMDTCKDRIFRPVEPKDVERYPDLWKAYDAVRNRGAMVGTPVDKLPGVSKDNAVILAMKGIRSVEDLAGLDDYTAGQHGSDVSAWRDIAKLYLQANKPVAKPIQKAA